MIREPSTGPGRGLPWWRSTTPLTIWTYRSVWKESIHLPREGRTVAVIRPR